MPNRQSRSRYTLPAATFTGFPRAYWSPIPYSWPDYLRKGSPKRKAWKTGRWRMFSSVNGRIDIYLKGSRTETPKGGAAGWLAKNLLLFAKQTESYSIKEFLRRYSEFLSETGQRNVLLMEIDYEEVYADRDDKDPNDLDDALAKAYEHISSSNGGNKLLLSTFGRTNNGLKNDLELTVEAQYYRKHGQGKPSIEVRVLGIPSALVKQWGEGDRQYKARVKRLFAELRTDVEREKFARKYENTAKVLVKDYEKRLKEIFDAEKTTRWLHIDWGGTGQNGQPRLEF